MAKAHAGSAVVLSLGGIAAGGRFIFMLMPLATMPILVLRLGLASRGRIESGRICFRGRWLFSAPMAHELTHLFFNAFFR